MPRLGVAGGMQTRLHIRHHRTATISQQRYGSALAPPPAGWTAVTLTSYIETMGGRGAEHSISFFSGVNLPKQRGDTCIHLCGDI
jgi:hypothetical protein